VYLLVMWRMVVVRAVLVPLGSTVARRCASSILTLSVKHILVFDSLGLPALLGVYALQSHDVPGFRILRKGVSVL
jgi:hypothetical protein